MIQIGDNFSYNGKKPNFTRDSFSTLLEMKNFLEDNIDEGHISYCLEDGNRYIWKSNNDISSITSKWNKLDSINIATFGIDQNGMLVMKRAESTDSINFGISENGQFYINLNN